MADLLLEKSSGLNPVYNAYNYILTESNYTIKLERGEKTGGSEKYYAQPDMDSCLLLSTALAIPLSIFLKTR